MTAAVILAAGASTRLGQPKQLVILSGETLLDRAARIAREAGCEPVVVVLGADAERISTACQLGGAQVVVNDGWGEGMASSIRVGVEAISRSDGVVLMTCDQPAVSPQHLRRLMSTGEVTGSHYANGRGVPAYFPASSFPELLHLKGDQGARELLRDAASINFPGGELDIDSAADLAEAVRRFR